MTAMPKRVNGAEEDYDKLKAQLAAQRQRTHMAANGHAKKTRMATEAVTSCGERGTTKRFKLRPAAKSDTNAVHIDTTDLVCEERKEPCGDITWVAGNYCKCGPCKLFLRSRERKTDEAKEA